MTTPSDLRILAFEWSASPMLVISVRHEEDDRQRLGTIQECSQTFTWLTGMSQTEVLGRSLADFVYTDDADVLDADLVQLCDLERRPQIRLFQPNLGTVWISLVLAVLEHPEDGSPLVVVTLDDVTGAREVQEKLARRATHDDLTGLPNRAVLTSHLSRVIARLERKPGAVGAIFVDLDGFKDVNDNFGHDVGDEILVEVAERITAAVRRHDVVTRIGGDEFVVICDDLKHQGESGQVAERIRRALEKPFEAAGQAHLISGSIGIAQTSNSKTGPETLLRQADLAMYRAKQRGRNRIEFFAESMDREARGRRLAGERFREALNSDQLTMDLQPIASLADSTIVGFASVARLELPDGQVWRSADFMAAAHAAGLAARVDLTMIDQAVEWLEGTTSSGWLGLNISGRVFESEGTVDRLLERLADRSVPPERIVLAVRADAVMASPDGTQMALTELRRAGVRVLIDSFGVGAGTLEVLKQVPVDMLRIGAPLIAGLGRSAVDESLVSAIVRIGKDLGHSVIAEGVERPRQAEFLSAQDCDMIQGGLIGPPAPALG